MLYAETEITQQVRCTLALFVGFWSGWGDPADWAGGGAALLWAKAAASGAGPITANIKFCFDWLLWVCWLLFCQQM